MSRWDAVWQQACECRAALSCGERTVAVADLLASAAAQTGIAAIPLSPGDSLLYGAQGVYDPEMGMIWYDETLTDATRHFVLAHEYAHHWLGHDPVIDTADDLAPDMAAEPGATQRVEGYTPFDLVERSANVFAREFLLPPAAVIPWFTSRSWGSEAVSDAPALAQYLGLPESLVYFQLTRALLLPAIAPDAHEDAGHTGAAPLDPGQREAAEWPSGPLLVEAGPGTGKTRTLVHRVTWLLEGGTPPESLLALTFSNRAAEELRSRVAAVRPDDAPRIWTGTIHAFALELLRKYAGKRIAGLSPGFAVRDPVEGRLRFAEIVVSLGLSRYDDLADPTAPFPAFFAAFSRAKDELADAARYNALAHAMPPGEDRARVLEVARAFTAYQDMLARENACDYGDLLRHAVTLLRDYAEVRDAVRAQYRQILVDEYQDVNTACVALVRLLAGDGNGLWVVGDARQAIYGFRGAKTGTLRDFPALFSGASVRALSINYRSRPAIVGAVNALADHINVGTANTHVEWLAHRNDAPGRFQYTVLPDRDAEMDFIAAEMTRLHEAGTPYREQAVLCRSHTVLNRVAMALEARAIPALFLGDLFERPEVRDLLSLIALATGPDGRGLVRVARFPQYAVPEADVRLLLDAAHTAGIAFPAALTMATGVATEAAATEAALPELSQSGRRGMQRIAADIEYALRDGAGVHTLLLRYLFDCGEYLRAVREHDSHAGRQQRFALFQLLDITGAFQRREGGGGGDALPRFGPYVRSMAITGEDRRFAQLPLWADPLDAVRLLTVHAAKGLEFTAVFVPEARKGHFPSQGRPERYPCLPPPGLLPDDAPVDGDEACIFFVALSRARDTLILTRPAYLNGNRSHRRTPWLDYLGVGDDPSFPAPPSPGGGPTDQPALPQTDSPARTPFDVHLLDRYRRCPRRYGYDYHWGFGDRLEPSAYTSFARCTGAALATVAMEHLDANAAVLRLDARWATDGPPADHPYARLYHSRAERTVRAATEAAQGATRQTYYVPVPGGQHVSVTPDAITTGDAALTVTHWSMRAKPKTVPDDDVYGLYAAIARTLAGDGQAWAVNTRYLVGGDATHTVHVSGKAGNRADAWVTTRLQHYADAIAGIVAGRFPAKPDDFACPRCPYYFICPGPTPV